MYLSVNVSVCIYVLSVYLREGGGRQDFLLGAIKESGESCWPPVGWRVASGTTHCDGDGRRVAPPTVVEVVGGELRHPLSLPYEPGPITRPIIKTHHRVPH